MQEELKLLSEPVNFAVVHLPGRAYPGVVLQGDTLQSFIVDLVEMKKLLERDDLTELAFAIDDMKSRLEEVQSYYELVCASNGITLPYFKTGA